MKLSVLINVQTGRATESRREERLAAKEGGIKAGNAGTPPVRRKRQYQPSKFKVYTKISTAYDISTRKQRPALPGSQKYSTASLPSTIAVIVINAH